ncbi:MAG: hypothetical protein NWE93_08900 [Candidatus Bathyarchaeota archaeon]|nr:hypothetical protein [Candidatus Bathyarchaeota archaeon]
MGAERVIHASIFVLLLVGIAALCFWASYTYLPLESNLILFVASIPLSWGILLLALYVAFSRLGWKWWS